MVALFEEKNLSCLLVEEDQTLMPILHNRDEKVALEHILGILDEVYGQKRDQTSGKLRDSSTSLRFARNDTEIQYDVVIFDRLHLTPIAICESSIAKFKQVEDILLAQDPTLVFLTINEKDIERRIFESIKHRGPSWGEYVHRKGNRQQILAHYKEAQEKLLKLTLQTSLPLLCFDTTDEDFDLIATEIARLF